MNSPSWTAISGARDDSHTNTNYFFSANPLIHQWRRPPPAPQLPFRMLLSHWEGSSGESREGPLKLSGQMTIKFFVFDFWPLKFERFA